MRPDGTITLPLIGDVTSSRAHAKRAARRNQDRDFTAFLRDDNPVEVIVETVNSYRFTVAGNVEKSGMFATSTRHRVSRGPSRDPSLCSWTGAHSQSPLARGRSRWDQEMPQDGTRDGHRDGEEGGISCRGSPLLSVDDLKVVAHGA